MIITRRKNESIVIDDNIVVVVVEILGDRVRLGIEGPKGVPSRHGEEASTPAIGSSNRYIASKDLQFFHKMDCKSAAKISEKKNLIHYATRDEAIQAGKRPCAECQP
jgi:carbon storage regulator